MILLDGYAWEIYRTLCPTWTVALSWIVHEAAMFAFQPGRTKEADRHG